MRVSRQSIVLAVAASLAACGPRPTTSEVASIQPHFGVGLLPSDVANRAQKINLLAHHPHDPGAFTEGLIFKDGYLYEGTGLEGQTNLRKVQISDGSVVKTQNENPSLFGEGITFWNGFIYQLTYKNHVGYVYAETDTGFEKQSQFTVDQDGWGLTNDDQYLIRSDGTEQIYFVDPDTLATVKTISVTDGDHVQTNINEMEYVQGAIFANIFSTPFIARIDPNSGNITAWYDGSPIADLNPSDDEESVLNGIAYDDASGKFYMTGKDFPNLYEVELPGYPLVDVNSTDAANAASSP